MPAKPVPRIAAALAVALLCAGGGPASAMVVDDFEAGLPVGADPTGIALGFFTFAGSGEVGIATTAAAPESMPGAAPGNTVLRADLRTDTFAGFGHVFENPTVTALAPQDWSAFDTLTLWLYGSNSGTELYIDVLDNREPGSTGYPFEIWTSTFRDDFAGWRQLGFPFAALVRKDIGNGAPDDGLGLTEVHGWALGALATGGVRTVYIDDVQLALVVPEPDTLALWCAGGLAVAGAVRRSRRRY